MQLGNRVYDDRQHASVDDRVNTCVPGIIRPVEHKIRGLHKMNAPGEDDETTDAKQCADGARSNSATQQQSHEEWVKNVEVLLDRERPKDTCAIWHRVTRIEKQAIVIGEIQKLSC